MTDSVTITSPNGGRTLTFGNVEGDYFSVAVDGNDCAACQRIYGFTDVPHLVALFASMAQEWRGWKGEKSWCSLEGEFELHATSDRLGHITLRVVLTNVNTGPAEPWRLEATLLTEAGLLQGLAGEVADLFAGERG